MDAGSVRGFVPPESVHVLHVNAVRSPDDFLQQRVQSWRRPDSFGTKFERETMRSRDDRKAIETLEKTVNHRGDRYEAGLL